VKIKAKKIVIISAVNVVLIVAASYIGGALISKARTGKFFFNLSDRKELLRPENCKEFSCQGFADFNDIKRETAKEIQINEQAHCILSNPLFGYYNICTRGILGFSKETLKAKPERTYRVLLLGGSQANINTIPLEQELDNYVRTMHGDRYDKGEVFGAAIGGGKQPMQLQAANALLGMGYEFDSIVNLNGWNEIMLTTAENKQAGIPPIYPRSHIDRLVLEQRNLAADRSLVSCTSLDPYLAWHPAYTVWSYQCVSDMRRSLSDSQNYGLMRSKLKLDNTSASQGEINQDALRVWRVSAQNLEAMAEKQNLQYLEVIQPTTSTDPDDGKCYSENFAKLYGLPKNNLLPAMSSEVLDLRVIESGENIYSDCVHLNDLGSRIVARKIINRLQL